jgi:hypothetical protein
LLLRARRKAGPTSSRRRRLLLHWLHGRRLRLLLLLLLLLLLRRSRGLLRSGQGLRGGRALGHLLLRQQLRLRLRLRGRGLLYTAHATRHGDLETLVARQARPVARLKARLPSLLPRLEELRRRLPCEDGAAGVGGDGGGDTAARGR